jgi:ParB family transcriptional regulator, chromosome partitioning protein
MGPVARTSYPRGRGTSSALGGAGKLCHKGRMKTAGRHPGEEPDRETQTLAAQIEADGGQVLGAYREPVGDHWHLFALLPADKVEPTPHQRDLSPTHAKRLQENVKRIDRFVDPVVAISPRPGLYWTPNGNHRRVVLEKLKAKMVPAIVIPEAEVMYEILALNTEKAHNLKEKSLEVIRMYRGLLEERPTKSEKDFTFQFESPHHITLGLLYEQNKRFAGGAFAPILKRVDKFLDGTLRRAFPDREERAEKVRAVDAALVLVVDKLKKRGIKHPYVKNFVLARTTPLTRQRKTLPSFDQTFTRLRVNIEAFDVGAVRYEDVQRSAIMAIPAATE